MLFRSANVINNSDMRFLFHFCKMFKKSWSIKKVGVSTNIREKGEELQHEIVIAAG